MKAPNRFIYYANPLQWARFFRKSRQSKGFYNFTFNNQATPEEKPVQAWIQINDEAEQEVSTGSTFKLYLNDTLRCRITEKYKNDYGVAALIGESELANIFKVNEEDPLTCAFNPTNCTTEGTYKSGTITSDSFSAVSSGTSLTLILGEADIYKE